VPLIQFSHIFLEDFPHPLLQCDYCNHGKMRRMMKWKKRDILDDTKRRTGRGV